MESTRHAVTPGERRTWSRTFSEADVRAFAGITGDAGQHHLQPDEAGRLMVHGLFTATLPTKLGGDMNFIARTMQFEFLRPVYTGDTIEIVGIVDEVAPHRIGVATGFTFTCTNQDGEVVMRGSSAGVIPA